MKKIVAGLLCSVSIAGAAALPASVASAAEIKAIKTVAPEYPRGAERRNIEGYVVVQYTVGTSGEVTSVAVVESSPAGIFDDAAVEAVNQWKFESPAEEVKDVQTKVTFKL